MSHIRSYLLSLWASVIPQWSIAQNKPVFGPLSRTQKTLNQFIVYMLNRSTDIFKRCWYLHIFKICIYLAIFTQSRHPPLQVTTPEIEVLKRSSLREFCCGFCLTLLGEITGNGNCQKQMAVSLWDNYIIVKCASVYISGYDGKKRKYSFSKLWPSWSNVRKTLLDWLKSKLVHVGTK